MRLRYTMFPEKMANLQLITYYKVLVFAILIYGLCSTIFGCVILYHLAPYCYFLSFSMIAVPLSLITAGILTGSLVMFQFSENKRYKLIVLTIVLTAEIGMILLTLLKRGTFENVLLKSYRSSFSNYLFINEDRVEWNSLQANLQCCGIDKPEDWNTILKRGLLPASCCLSPVKSDEAFCRYKRRSGSTVDWYKIGCYRKLLDSIWRYSLYAVIFEIVNIVLEVIVVVTSLYIKSRFWNENKVIGNLQWVDYHNANGLSIVFPDGVIPRRKIQLAMLIKKCSRRLKYLRQKLS